MLPPAPSSCSDPPRLLPSPPPHPPVAPSPPLAFSCQLEAHPSSRAPKLTFCREQPASENHFLLKNLTEEFY